MQLSKRSKPTKVHWTSLPTNEEKLESQKFPDKKLIDQSIKDDVLNSSNLISLKERINQLKINNSPEHIMNKKPKILPKPIISKVSIPIDNPMVTKVRGKLDKSYSTPSYDFSADSNLQSNFEYFDSDLRMSVEDVQNYDTNEVTTISCDFNEDKNKRPDKPVLVFPKPPPPRSVDDVSFTESVGVNCINKSVKPVLYFPKPPPKTEDIDFPKLKDTPISENFGFEPQNRNIEQSSCKVSESESGFSFDLKQEENIESSTKSILENENVNFFDDDNSITSLSHEKNPVSIDYSKYSLKQHHKNKSYLNKKLQDSPDFEKNSFSDLSDVCPPLSLTDLSGSDDNIFQVDTKDNISLPSERTAIIPHQDVFNTPATFPRQKTEAKKSQPPIPPPRPSKPAELPKRTSYRAMLGAKAIGKKENKGQKQLFQRNPLISSNDHNFLFIIVGENINTSLNYFIVNFRASKYQC